jgi:dTDP-4-dehydrorhamnose reductase
MKKTDSIYVLGSNGFVGSNLFKQLKEDGYSNVYGYNRQKVDLLDKLQVLEIRRNKRKY